MDRLKQQDIAYLNAAFNIASLSKDNNTHVGAKIISSDGRPVSEGRNGGSRNIDDADIPYSREYVDIIIDDKVIKENKYPFMIHAEENALLFTQNRYDLQGATIYVTHVPCPSCANKISQCGITRVVYPSGSAVAMTGEHQQLLTKYIFLKSNIEVVEVDMEHK